MIYHQAYSQDTTHSRMLLSWDKHQQKRIFSSFEQKRSSDIFKALWQWTFLGNLSSDISAIVLNDFFEKM